MAVDLAKKLRNITKEEALESYDELKELDCQGIRKHARKGLECLDYFFFKHRIKAKTRRNISFFDAYKDKDILNYLDEKLKKIRNVDVSTLNETALAKQRYSIFQLYYGSINQFRPTEAKRVYCLLKPKIGILDFSAGWGGRCLAAISLDIPYIGIDVNENLKKSYEDMVSTINPSANVQMVFQPSEKVDFSKFKYDLIFTSPPYFFFEKYEKMPTYESKDMFLTTFFIPVVMNSWKHLLPSGYMALNMPKEMYDSVKSQLPKVWKQLRLPISSRHPKEAAKGEKIGEVDKGQRFEKIYIWKNLRNTTRKTTTKVI